MDYLQVIVVLLRQGLVLGIIHLLLVLGEERLVDLGSGGSKGRGGDEILAVKGQ